MLQDMRLGSPPTLQEQSLLASSFSPVKKQLKTVKSSKKVMATVLCYVYGVLLVGFTNLASAVNTDP